MPHSKPIIAFLLNSLEFGGAQRVFIDDANDFVSRGYSVHFFVLYGDKETYPLGKELDSRISVIFLHARGPLDGAAVRRCVHELRHAQTAFLFSTLNDGNIFARWVALFAGNRIRLILREANSLRSKTAWQKMLDVMFSCAPYRVIVLSREMQLSLEKLLPFCQKKIVLLPNAVAVPTTQHQQKSDNSVQILSVGRLTHQKNYELLISALGNIAREDLTFTVVIAGEGELRSALEKQIVRENLSERVVLSGHLTHDAVLELYKKADIFVSTSRWEGGSNVILEAMSYGLPVVATNVGNVSEVIRHSDEGLLVPSEQVTPLVEAIKNLIANEKLREVLGSNARKRIEADFSREKRFDQLRAIMGLL